MVQSFFEIRHERRVLVRAHAQIDWLDAPAGGPPTPWDFAFRLDDRTVTGRTVTGRTPAGQLIGYRDRHLIRLAHAEGATGLVVELEVPVAWLCTPVVRAGRLTLDLIPVDDPERPAVDLDRVALWDLTRTVQHDLLAERRIALGEAA